ncbi:MAG: isoprenylcysteine carboxylmethyltransferase family protein [Pirellulaceae bacterium]|nr:isoprenylcysteine carboxylmethyltransferase family protein [Pirellulaceae bacterium]
MLSGIRGREADPASCGWNVAKTLAQTLVFWLVFLVLLPAAIYRLEYELGIDGARFGSSASQWTGVGLFVLGGTLGMVSGVMMAVYGAGTPLPLDCPRRLVVVGPYRYVRNPMAVAGLCQGIAVGLILGSPAVVAYAALGGPVWHLLVRPWEEADLEARFGESYRRYRTAVRCWLPRSPGR